MRAETALLVDAGNSRIKWGVWHAGLLSVGRPFCRRGEGLAQDMRAHWGELPVPDQVLVSNVAGDRTAAELRSYSIECWGVSPQFVQASPAACGVCNGYEVPEALGVDRWIALIGARGVCPDSLCLADCGTALTLDAMDAQGRHLGGLIAPGLEMMRQSLNRGAAALSSLPAGRFNVPARNTADGVHSGILQMAAGLIEGFARTMTPRFGAAPHLILTGGDAPIVSETLSYPHRLETDLTLRGLLLIAEDAK